MFQRFITIFAVQMRRYSFIALLLCAVLFMMANADYQFRKKHKRASNDSIAINKAVRKDSAGREIIDTTKMDSLQLAIYRHNKQIRPTTPWFMTRKTRQLSSTEHRM